ncbi:MAG: translesion error-prone DNA polymerase V autoproteolytic subunit [Bacteroidales bacterium]|nr:translesion error-prone DNA polymerase V autoproteolytic subunit [Bacteroidales bacterium]
MEIYKPYSNQDKVPYVEGIRAGFPSPAEDFTEPTLDLNRYVIKNPASTFYARISGSSMEGADIHDGDIAVIDKSIEPSDGSIAVCLIDGEFTLKRIKVEKDKVWLMPANPQFSPILITEENHFIVWGIVTFIIKQMR